MSAIKFAIRSAFNKSADNYNNHAFLQEEIAKRLEHKLNTIIPNTNTPLIVDLGAGTGLLSEKLLKRYPNSQLLSIDFAQNSLKNNPATHKICADAEQLPLADNSVDIIISNLMMQWCEDLNALFLQSSRVLKNQGLLLFSTFGPDTLKELKKSWSAVDQQNHVNNFIDMHNIGDTMLQQGLQNPVLEMEIFTLTYQTVIDLMHDLKALGAQILSNGRKSLTGKTKFQTMLKLYESYRIDGKLPATFEVIYAHAWKKTSHLKKIDIDNNP